MPDLETTRLSLHAIAELLVAGPQFEESRTIKLRVTPGGFGTVAIPEAGVEGTDLVTTAARVPFHGRTIADVAADAGIKARPLDDVYTGGCGLTVEHRLLVADAWAQEIADAFRRGDEAMAAFAPEAERVLWPEHFDLGITVDKVNYGLSPGDSYLQVPYAYVGPWEPDDFHGSYWNAPFGAARPLTEVTDLRAFYEEGRDLT